MKIFFILFLFTLSFSQDFTKIRHFNNADGELIYAHFKGSDFEDFFTEFKPNGMKVNLEVLKLEKISMDHFEISTWIDFFQNEGKNLHTITINESKSSISDTEDLLYFIKGLSHANIKTFHWTNNKDLDDQEILEFSNYNGFWDKLEELSFEGTEFYDAIFIFDHISLKNLKRLNLKDTKLTPQLLTRIAALSDKFPLLEELILDKNPKLSEMQINGSIPSLKTLSLIFKDEQDEDEMQSMLRNKPLFQTLDNLYLNPEYNEGIHKGAYKYLSTGKLQPLPSDDLESILNYNLKNTGMFLKYSKDLNLPFSHKLTSDMFFINSSFAVPYFIKHYKDISVDNIYITSSSLTRKHISDLILNINPKFIHLINSPITSNNLDQIRSLYPETQINLVNIMIAVPKGQNESPTFQFDNSSDLQKQMKRQMKKRFKEFKRTSRKF